MFLVDEDVFWHREQRTSKMEVVESSDPELWPDASP
jgi:hypothetical protein